MNVQEVGIFEPKTHLSEFMEKVQKDVTTYRITKRGKPVAELRPIEEAKKPFRLKRGYAKDLPGRYYVATDFDEPLKENLTIITCDENIR